MGRIAAFFREQNISLAQQQKAKMVSLDREFEEMEAEVQRLNTKVLHLEAKVNPLEREVERLKQQIEQKGASGSHDKLDEISEKMLSGIANGTGEKAKVIAMGGGPPAKGEHHIDILVRRGLIFHEGFGGMGSWYRATPEGRQYLADHNLF
jgi:predicted nuclease with TOPRIM domain